MFQTFIYLHLLCFSSSSSNTCPILPTESCLLVWKYVLLHSSVKQPTCISPSDQALIAFPNLIIKSLLFLFFFFYFIIFYFFLIGLYLHTFAFCNAVMGVCYVVHTSVCFAILIHTFLMVQEIRVVQIGLLLVWLHLCILEWLFLLKCISNTYNTIYGSVLHGYRGSLHDTASMWQHCYMHFYLCLCLFKLTFQKSILQQEKR